MASSPSKWEPIPDDEDYVDEEALALEKKTAPCATCDGIARVWPFAMSGWAGWQYNKFHPGTNRRALGALTVAFLGAGVYVNLKINEHQAREAKEARESLVDKS